MIKVAVIVVTGILLASAIAYGGARWIYYQAWEDSYSSKSSTDAALLAAALTRFRAGEEDDALALLEVYLDSALLSARMHNPKFKRFISELGSPNFTVMELACKAAPYRTEHNSTDPELAEDIQAFLEECM